MSWRDVPMPAAIAARPREKHGFPVPYVSAWSDAHDGPPLDRQMLVATVYEAGVPTKWVANVAVDRGGPATGTPQLGKLDELRQRECMTKPKCQVCGMVISPKGPFLFVADVSAADPREWELETGEKVTAALVGPLSEPMLHEACAWYSVQVCPGITSGIHRDADKDREKRAPAVYRCRKYDLLAQWLVVRDDGTGDRVVGAEPPTPRSALAFYVAFLKEFVMEPVDEFVERHRAKYGVQAHDVLVMP